MTPKQFEIMRMKTITLRNLMFIDALNHKFNTEPECRREPKRIVAEAIEKARRS